MYILESNVIRFPKTVREYEQAQDLDRSGIIALIERLIDAYMNVRLSLSIKSVVNDGITREEKNKIFDEAKAEANDPVVIQELNIFSAMLDKEFETKNRLSLDDMEKIINPDNYSDTGQEKGVSKVKRDGHFKNSADDLRNVA